MKFLWHYRKSRFFRGIFRKDSLREGKRIRHTCSRANWLDDTRAKRLQLAQQKNKKLASKIAGKSRFAIVPLCYFLTFFLLANASGARATSLSGTTIAGQKFDLKDFYGRVVIINFWASWCADCLIELPILDEIYKRYHASGLEIIGVSVDSKNRRSKVLELVSDKKYPNTTLADLTTNDFDEVELLPTSYIIDREGNVAKTIIITDRQITKKDFEEVVAPLLR